MNEVLAQALVSIIQYLGTFPILLFFAVIFLFPTAIQIWANYKQAQYMAKFNKSYDDNVALVKAYQNLVKIQQETNDKLIDLVSISTGTQQTLVEYIKNNWWCPAQKDPAFFGRSKETQV